MLTTSFCRNIVDPANAIDILTRAVFSSIERIAATDVKYGSRLRFENYLLYLIVINMYAAENPVLAYFVKAAGSCKDDAIQV